MRWDLEWETKNYYIPSLLFSSPAPATSSLLQRVTRLSRSYFYCFLFNTIMMMALRTPVSSSPMSSAARWSLARRRPDAASTWFLSDNLNSYSDPWPPWSPLVWSLFWSFCNHPDVFCRFLGRWPLWSLCVLRKVFTHTEVDLASSSVTCTPKNKKIKSLKKLFSGDKSFL